MGHFAIAPTPVFSSAFQLILARDPVRFEAFVQQIAGGTFMPERDTNFTNCHQSEDDSRFASCGFVKFVSKIVASLAPKESASKILPNFFAEFK